MTTAANQAAHAEKVQLVEAFRTACRQWHDSDPATDTVQLLAAKGKALHLSARALVEYLERTESREPPHCYTDCMAAMQSLQRSATPSLEGLRDRLFDEPLPARHSDGHCYHPAIPDTDEDVNIVMLLAAFGVACTLVSMESDAPALHEALLEAGDPDFSAWNPTPPAGDGWRLLALYDTEDGPFALFGRKDHTAAFPKRAAASMQPVQETEMVLVNGVAHPTPAPVASELLRLHMALQEALGTAPPAKAPAAAARHAFIGSPVEIGDAVFRELCLPVIAAASRQPAAKPAQLLQMYSGFICSCLGALAADIGHERAIEVAQMNVETFSHIDLEAPQNTH